MAKDPMQHANRDLLVALLDDEPISDDRLTALFTRAAANNPLTLLKVAVWYANTRPGPDEQAAIVRLLRLLALYAKFMPAAIEYNIEAVATYGSFAALIAVSRYSAGASRFIKKMKEGGVPFVMLPPIDAPTCGALLKRIVMLPEFRAMRVK